MNRRNLIKGLAAFGALSVMPSQLISDKKNQNRIHYIGLGGAGCQIVDYILKNKKPQNSSFICIEKERISDLSPQIKQLSFSVEEQNKQHFLTPEIRDVFTKGNRYVLIGGLGGVTGTYLFEKLNRWLFEQNHNFLSVCNTPFAFEGRKRSVIAESIIQQFQYRDNFEYFAADTIRETHGNLSLSQAFREIDNLLYELAQKHLQENA